MKLHRAPTDRNAEPIREVLERLLPEGARVLEVASGSGQHAVHMARAFPTVDWHPTDLDPKALASIDAYAAEAALSNLRPAFALDVVAGPWPEGPFDVVFCVNMIHIAPWAAACGLFAGASRVLAPEGMLVTYGPYRFGGTFTAPTNAEFDASLRARDAAWGVRDVDDLDAEAARHGLRRAETIAMPANNHVLVYRRRPS